GPKGRGQLARRRRVVHAARSGVRELLPTPGFGRRRSPGGDEQQRLRQRQFGHRQLGRQWFGERLRGRQLERQLRRRVERQQRLGQRLRRLGGVSTRLL